VHPWRAALESQFDSSYVSRDADEQALAAVSDIKEYYDLPDNWDSLNEKQHGALLIEMAVEELNNSGVGSGASVVDMPEVSDGR
jgi:hypothetical protein